MSSGDSRQSDAAPIGAVVRMIQRHSAPAICASRLREWRPGGVSNVTSKPGRGFAAEEFRVEVRAHQNLGVREHAHRQRIVVAQHRVDPFAHQQVGVEVVRFGLPDAFVPHGDRARLLRDIGLTPQAVAAAALLRPAGLARVK